MNNGNPMTVDLSNNPLFNKVAEDFGSKVNYIYTTDCFDIEKYPLTDAELFELGKKLVAEKGYKWQQDLEHIDDLDEEEEYHCIYLIVNFEGVDYNLSLDRQGEVEISQA